MSSQLSFLVIDDEKPVVVSLRTLISKAFPGVMVYTASNGVEGWESIEENHPSIVICDLSMPGMNGLQVLEKVREHEVLNDIYFIILTANVDRNERLAGLGKGADDYLSKPFANDEIMARLRSATRFVTLQLKTREENLLLQQMARELERSFNDMILLAVKFLQARIPAPMDMLKQVADSSYWIAKSIGGFENDALKDVKVASFLCIAGKIGLPDEYLNMPVVTDGHFTHQVMSQVPITAREVVSSIRQFKDVGKILYHLYENFDGSGMPDRLQSWQIPLPSRIIRVALDFAEMRFFKQLPAVDALENIKKEASRLYDTKIVMLLDQYLGLVSASQSDPTEKAVPIEELEDGMVLSREIVTTNGLKLLPAGATLRSYVIQRIISHNNTDPILGFVFVKTKK